MTMAGQSVWVTGASLGIGRELALLLAREGASVACTARSETLLRALQDGQPGVAAHPGDVTDAPAMAALLKTIESLQGPLDVAVFNAGVYEQVLGGLAAPALFRRHIEVNYLGVVNGVMAVLPGMLRRGRGQVVIVASPAGYRGLPRAAAYGPTKAALISLAETLRLETHGSGVAVRLVNPGFVDTRLTARNDFPMPALMSAPEAARHIVRGLRGRSFEIAFPGRFVFWLKVARMLPYRWYFPLMSRLTRK